MKLFTNFAVLDQVKNYSNVQKLLEKIFELFEDKSAFMFEILK